MYRDAGNCKNHGEVIMPNPDNISLIEAIDRLEANLIDDMYFYAHELEVPDLHFPDWDDAYDHSWHEFVSLEETEEAPTAKRTLKEFLSSLKKQKA